MERREGGTRRGSGKETIIAVCRVSTGFNAHVSIVELLIALLVTLNPDIFGEARPLTSPSLNTHLHLSPFYSPH